MEKTKDRLQIDSFAEAEVEALDCDIPYLVDLLPASCISVEDLNELALAVEEMKQTDGETLKYLSVLSVEQPEDFPAALRLAINFDDYERVLEDVSEYGEEILRRLGADDEVLDAINGYAYIRRTSDRLCKEHGLSVVKPGQSKGKSYAEWDAQRKGTSWKAKLKVAIDVAILKAKDFDDFLRLMQAQGYEIKPGKFISFRAPGQERFTRCKTLGEAYTEEAIKERIKSRAITRRPKERKGISLRIDLENSIKAQQSAGYEKWAKLHNLKQAAMTLNFLTEHGIDTYPDLEIKVAEITAASDEAAAALKAAEYRLADIAVLIKNVTIYKQLRPVALEYRKAADKAKFRREHESTLILYEAAAKALKEQGMKKLPDLYALKAEHKRLAEEKERLYEQYGEAKKQMQEYGIIKQNVDGILWMTPRKEWSQEL